MKEYFYDMVVAVTKALEGNNLVVLDRQRLDKAERVGPGCTEKLR